MFVPSAVLGPWSVELSGATVELVPQRLLVSLKDRLEFGVQILLLVV
jgi:hypothetical protein